MVVGTVPVVRGGGSSLGSDILLVLVLLLMEILIDVFVFEERIESILALP